MIVAVGARANILMSSDASKTPKSGAAVTPMPASSSEIHYLVRGDLDPGMMAFQKALRPFEGIVTRFLSDLSECLWKQNEIRRYPDVATFAFFVRNANLKFLEAPYLETKTSEIGRGVSFHIAPSNVPVNFAYSLVAGLLSGNACIVRVSDKQFPQVDIICHALNQVLSKTEYSELRKYILVVRYGHDQSLNEYFSSICDVRIIWGGDQTIMDIRNAVLPPRSIDIAFSDRYSLCIIHAESYLQIDNKQEIAERFYNDTYLFDQNACSSPRLIYWLGEDDHIEIAKKSFWEAINILLLKKNYQVEPVVAVDKYTMFCRQAILLSGVRLENGRIDQATRLRLYSLDASLPLYMCPGGFYVEYSDASLEALASIVNSKYQTLTYLGMDANVIRQYLLSRGVKGIDRIVPIGEAARFSLVWDGYDLIRQMTRTVDIG